MPQENQVLYSITQEEIGSEELHGTTWNLAVAIAWVEKLIQRYNLTHFDVVAKVDEYTWEGKYASFYIRVVTPLEEPPEVPLRDWEALTLRLLDKIDPTIQLGDLPEFLKPAAQLEIEGCGPDSVLLGRDEEMGFFVLHKDSDLVYVVDSEHGDTRF